MGKVVKDNFRIEEIHGSSSCAVVSNSGALLKYEHGESIDRHSAVIRFNGVPILEEFKSVAGTKISLRVAVFNDTLFNVSENELVYAPRYNVHKLKKEYPTAKFAKSDGDPKDVLPNLVEGMKSMYH